MGHLLAIVGTKPVKKAGPDVSTPARAMSRCLRQQVDQGRTPVCGRLDVFQKKLRITAKTMGMDMYRVVLTECV